MTTTDNRTDNRTTAERKKGQGSFEKDCLSFAQKLRVARFVEAHKERLLRDRPDFKDVAAEISKELGFNLTGNSLRGVAKATGVYWKKLQVRTGVKRPSRIRSRIALLTAQVQALRSAVSILCSRLGESPPAEVTSMWPVGKNDSEEPRS